MSLGPHFDTPIAAGGNLCLRPLRFDDLPAVAGLLADPAIMRSVDWKIDEIADAMGEPDIWPFLALRDEEAIGYLQVYHANADPFWRAFGVPCETVGLDMMLSARGQGIGSRLTRAVISHAFAHSDIVRVQIDPGPQNTRAIGAYRKAGLEPRGVFRGYDAGEMMQYMAMDRTG